MPTLVLLWVLDLRLSELRGLDAVRAASAECRRLCSGAGAGVRSLASMAKKTSPHLLPRLHWQNIGGVSAARFRSHFWRWLPWLPWRRALCAEQITTRWLIACRVCCTGWRRISWHWIHTTFPRVTLGHAAIEWVSAPFIALLHTDRLLFLINFISFLLLARTGFQRVHAAWGAASCGVALDVDSADGLLFSAAGRQYRQRPLWGGVCDRGGGFCLRAKKKAPVGPATFIPRCWPQHC